MITSQQLQTFKQTLMNMKQEIEERLEKNDHYNLERGHAHESTGELSSYDNHPADEGSELFEREKDIALKQHQEYELEKIENALKAIENGSYGNCKACGKDISFERLEAIPTTLYCKEHTLDQNVSHQRPIEEDVLMPPFGKWDLDEKDESVAFDAEDSWQEVATWGTSESPSDFFVPPTSYNDNYVEYDENVGYVEDYENFIGTDIDGKNIRVFPTSQHEDFENALDEEGIMTTFGDLPAYEHDPYVEDRKKRKR
ncbi:TraR/DksA C4-type zinc finger protein [Bacillus litorisediminis]|uniref:TraR/DksA C4-type zinc finger protein n=1 Tax=Bacillus litorisediminis TaxID=2922713 RepID=UPI001FAED9D0|nr:TraR/DksA C4-type zinc finger protein [Bacillus litorisediminis]